MHCVSETVFCFQDVVSKRTKNIVNEVLMFLAKLSCSILAALVWNWTNQAPKIIFTLSKLSTIVQCCCCTLNISTLLSQDLWKTVACQKCVRCAHSYTRSFFINISFFGKLCMHFCAYTSFIHVVPDLLVFVFVPLLNPSSRSK